MIKSVIRNLVDNAVKNTTQGSITLAVGYPPGKQMGEISIADEGKGMREEQLAALNQYFQTSQNALPSGTSGFGHKVIKDFLFKMGGTIQYRHNHPSGIVATVNLPTINEEQLYAE